MYVDECALNLYAQISQVATFSILYCGMAYAVQCIVPHKLYVFMTLDM